MSRQAPDGGDRWVVEVEDVKKSFEEGRIQALRGLSLKVKRREFVAVMGPSGSGKSTLLNLLGAMDKPDSGTVRVASHDIARLKDDSSFRARTVGFVFQLHNLIPTLTASENVQIPMFETVRGRARRVARADELLELVGLGERKDAVPVKLSGGERQRVAIARALANDPVILLADEPTGNLDSKTSMVIIKLLKKVRDDQGTTVVLVTHDPEVALQADRVIHVRDGLVEAAAE
ncbi:MAG: ABC transporter ATP-binding protein [Candidatus Aquicultorales bacterium]